jgi:hypothetical protein
MVDQTSISAAQATKAFSLMHANARWYIAMVFIATAAVALVGGALLATGVVRLAGPPDAWLWKYLIWIVGCAQLVAGGGCAWLSRKAPSFERVATTWSLLNLGSLGVITGSLIGNFTLVSIGTASFDIALVLFLAATRRARYRYWSYAYRVVLVPVLVASWVGVLFAARIYPL